MKDLFWYFSARPDRKYGIWDENSRLVGEQPDFHTAFEHVRKHNERARTLFQKAHKEGRAPGID